MDMAKPRRSFTGTFERLCDHCGKLYTAHRVTSQYCSERCRKAALRKRRVESVERHEPPVESDRPVSRKRLVKRRTYRSTPARTENEKVANNSVPQGPISGGWDAAERQMKLGLEMPADLLPDLEDDDAPVIGRDRVRLPGVP